MFRRRTFSSVLSNYAAVRKSRFVVVCVTLAAALLLAPNAASSAPTPTQPFKGLPGISPTGYLYAAAVLGSRSMIAGGVGVGDPAHARLQRWNGSMVSTMPSGNVNDDPFSAYVSDFAVVSSTDVWAIGGYCDYHYCSGLQARWTGKAWKAITTPNVLFSDGLKTYATDAITAVGGTIWISGANFMAEYSGETDSYAAMILRRDTAGHWTQTVLPRAPGGADSEATGLYAASPTNIWAAGYYWSGSNVEATHQIVWHYDGKAWRVVPVPAPPNTVGVTSMRGSGPGDIWLTLCASAHYGYCDSPSNTLLHYSSGTWTTVTAPSGWRISAVRSAGAKDLWAVGTLNNSALAAHWQGQTWQRIPVQLPSTSTAELNAVILTAHQVIAVGDQQAQGQDYPHTVWVARPR